MPNFSKVSKIIMAVVFIIAGFFIAQSLRTNLLADPQTPRNRFAEIDALNTEERNKSRFVGVIDGIFIAPEGTAVPDEYTTFEDVCGDPMNGSRVASWEEAGELDLELDLPSKYVLQEDDLNTGAVACNSNDVVYVARRTYLVGLAQVTIGRSLFDSEQIDVAVDRPKAAYVASRDVVIIDSLTADGMLQNAYAFFPEPFGKTFISAVGLSRAEFGELVALVASSTR